MYDIYSGIELMTLIFDKAIKKWNLSTEQFAAITWKYKLPTYVCEHQETLNSYGLDSCVKELERQIMYKKTGKYNRHLENFKIENSDLVV